ncbi:DNA (cytosine-5-)-methyltransferase N-terminal subunit [Mycoplasmopsis lipofaciens]|uniref:DNA (cytosine-5-)-methyltransferase N-terminal subunit n=1 Tax=Mycoplasmopsis lipofaciens TaxID=114884 RepID=UPI00056CEEA3|nr:hypothetical protein [Mycoplasmopsis lipofaciens]
MKTIRLFEAFAGIGSQYKALKNIKNKSTKIKSIGAIEWYIDAIISYQLIHYGKLNSEKQMTKNEMAKILHSYNFSSDSKTAVSKTYFYKINEKKLRQIFPYLYSFVDNKYFNKVYKKRERERDIYRCQFS